MSCMVPGCKSRDPDFTKKVSLHRCPNDIGIKLQWTVNTGLKLSKYSKICSLHFEPSCFRSVYRWKVLNSDAVPTIFPDKSEATTLPGPNLLIKRLDELQENNPYLAICRICLATNCKMFPITELKLKWYENLTGLYLPQFNELPKWLCAECSQRLINVNKFRDKALHAHKLLMEVLEDHDTINLITIKAIDRKAKNLESSLQINNRPGPIQITTIKYEKDAAQREDEDEFLCEYLDEEYNDDVVMENNSVDEIVIKKVEGKYMLEDDDGFDKKEGNVASEDNTIIDKIDEDFVFNETDEKFEIDEENVTLTEDDTETKCSEAALSTEHDGDKVKEKDVSLELWHRRKGHLGVRNLKLLRDKMANGETDDNQEIESENPLSENLKKTRKGRKRKKNDKTNEETDVDGFTQTHLSLNEQIAELKKRKLSKSYEKCQYKCNLCYTGLHCNYTYERHMEKHTNKCGEFKCQLCKLYFRTKETLQKHVKNKHSCRYTCEKCPKFVTLFRAHAVLHNKMHKGEHKCPHCPEVFKHPSTKLSHILKKHPSPYDCSCDLCGYTFVSEQAVHYHKREVHDTMEQTVPEDGPFCNICNIRFLNDEAYNNHIKFSTKHSTNEGECNEQRSKEKSTLYSFYMNCEKCNKQYTNSQTYRRHMNQYHPEELNTRNKRKRKVSINAINEEDQEKHKIMCDQCGKLVWSKQQLLQHSWVHTGEKAYRCEECGKGFTTKYSMEQHMRAHHKRGELFACDLCDRTFTWFNNLVRHKYKHSGLRPYKCRMCDKSFKSKYEEKCHVSHVHLNNPWPTRNRNKEKKKCERRRIIEINSSTKTAPSPTKAKVKNNVKKTSN